MSDDPRLVRLRENLAARGWTTLGHMPRQPYEVWTRGDGQRIEGVFDSIVIPVDPTKIDFEPLMDRAYRLAGDVLVIPVEGTAQADELVRRIANEPAVEQVFVSFYHGDANGASEWDVIRAVLAALRAVARDD